MGSRSRGPEGVSQGVGRVPDPGLLGVGRGGFVLWGTPSIHARAWAAVGFGGF